MISNSIRAAVAAAALAGSAVSGVPCASAASFDGPWSVHVITRSGPCDQSYRYGLMIRDGRVSYLGGGAVSISGTVSRNGRVSVSVSSGAQSAFGSGRLANGRGSGTWRGQAAGGACSGVWSASQG
jgi:hypothetical protein